MKRFLPLLLIVPGLCVIFVGFVYDVLFAGIPYQDPTLALSARYEFHAGVASLIGWCGLGLVVLGGVGIIVLRLIRPHSKTNSS